MPHVMVKLYSGRTEEKKSELAREIARTVMAVLQSADRSVSVGIEDVDPADWDEKVYKPDIAGRIETLYKKPGYGSLLE